MGSDAGGGARGRLTLAQLSPAEAELICTWRYPGDLAIYDGSAENLAGLLDPANAYVGMHQTEAGTEAFLGHACVGADARVSGERELDGVDDLGIGLSPQLVGQGHSRWLVPALLAELERTGRLTGQSLRVIILAWNLRSQRAFARAGFSPAGDHVTPAGARYVVLTRPRVL